MSLQPWPRVLMHGDLQVVRYKADAEGAPLSASPPPPQRHIVLAVDGSEDSQYAVEWAIQHMYRNGDHVLLVHCLPSIPPGQLVSFPGLGMLQAPSVHPALIAAKELQEANGALPQKLMQPLSAAGVSSDLEIVAEPVTAASGPSMKAAVGQVLCDKAAASGAAAIIVASTSSGGVREWMMGSIAEYLTRHSPCPVVVLHRPREGDLRKVGQPWWLASTVGLEEEAPKKEVSPQPPPLGPTCAAQRDLAIAVDETEESVASVEWVLVHLWRPGDVIHLIHIVPALPNYMAYSLAPDGMLYSVPLPHMAEAKVQEEQWRSNLATRFGPLLSLFGAQYQVDVVTDYGSDPLEGVAVSVSAMAERMGADALVLVNHGKGALMEWLLGSVSSYCAHHCSRPVVVLHGSADVED